MKKLLLANFFLILSALFTLWSRPSFAQSAIENQFIQHCAQIPYEEVLDLPIQDRGRIKPFDTFARESVLFIIGRRTMFDLHPAQIYLGLLTFQGVGDLPILNIRFKEVIKKIGLDQSRSFFTVNELQDFKFQELAAPDLEQEKNNKRLLTTIQKNTIETVHQLWLLLDILSREHLGRAINFQGMSHGHNQSSGTNIIFENFLRSLSPEQDSGTKITWINDLQKYQEKMLSGGEFASATSHFPLEIWYNSFRPFFWAGIFYLILAIIMFIPKINKYLGFSQIFGLTIIPSIIVIAGFSIRIIITEFPPVTNMYGTMLWVSLGISVFGILLFSIYKNRELLGLVSVGSAFCLLLAENFPLILSPDMDPIVAVLRNRFWLTTHVLTITISYGALAISMLLGNFALIKFCFNPQLKIDEEIKGLSHLAYRSIQLGVFLLTVGIILGGVWADYSWGRFWGWDPKETWALIADLGYLLILHARYQGWLKGERLLFAAPLAFLLVIMAWYGVNFILATGLHSYGFSSGGAAMVMAFVTVQLLLFVVSTGVFYFKKNPKTV